MLGADILGADFLASPPFFTETAVTPPTLDGIPQIAGKVRDRTPKVLVFDQSLQVRVRSR